MRKEYNDRQDAPLREPYASEMRDTSIYDSLYPVPIDIGTIMTIDMPVGTIISGVYRSVEYCQNCRLIRHYDPDSIPPTLRMVEVVPGRY